jgi:hypothetical protein
MGIGFGGTRSRPTVPSRVGNLAKRCKAVGQVPSVSVQASANNFFHQLLTQIDTV